MEFPVASFDRTVALSVRSLFFLGVGGGVRGGGRRL